MNFLKKIAASLLAVTLLLSACSNGDMTWAFRSGEMQITPGLYILYEISALGEAEEKIGEEDPSFAGMKTSELLKQLVEGRLVTDWVKTRAEALAAEHLTVLQKFGEMGLELSETDLASIENSLSAAVSGSSGFYEKNGVSESTLREYYTGVARRSRMFTALYGEGGVMAAPETELKEYFTDTYSLLDVMLLPKPTSVPEDETKTIEELEAETKAEAEGYLARLRAGEEIEQLEYEWTLSQTAEEERENVTKPEKDALNMVVSESMRESYGDAIVDAAFSANIGDSELVEDDYYFWVFNRRDALETSDIYDMYKSSILQELRKDDYEAVLESWASVLPIEANASVIDRYTPEKIKEA